FGRIPVGQYLVVGDQHQDLRAEILQPNPVPQRAEVVTQVQLPGRPVAGQDAERRRVLVDQFLEFGRTPVLDGHGHDYRPPVGPDGSTRKGRPSGRPLLTQDAAALGGQPPLRHTMHEPRIARSQRHYPERAGLPVFVSLAAGPGGGAGTGSRRTGPVNPAVRYAASAASWVPA